MAVQTPRACNQQAGAQTGAQSALVTLPI